MWAWVQGFPGDWGLLRSPCPVAGGLQESLARGLPEAERVVSPPWRAARLMLPRPPGHPGHVPVVTEKRHQLWNSTEKPYSSVWRRSPGGGERGREGQSRMEGLLWGWSPEARGGDSCVGFPNRQTDCTPEHCCSGLLQSLGLPEPRHRVGVRGGTAQDRAAWA